MESNLFSFSCKCFLYSDFSFHIVSFASDKITAISVKSWAPNTITWSTESSWCDGTNRVVWTFRGSWAAASFLRTCVVKIHCVTWPVAETCTYGSSRAGKWPNRAEAALCTWSVRQNLSMSERNNCQNTKSDQKLHNYRRIKWDWEENLKKVILSWKQVYIN